MARHIEVVDYDPTWPAAFDAEAARLRDLFGADCVAIHHVGSTAVPGLRAKPVIDVMVLLRDIARIETFNESMVALGYRVRGECLDAPVPGTPGRFYFSKDVAGVRTHQVHAMATDHFDAEAKLAFRDYLRAHPDVAEAYARVKMRGAADHTHDIFGYIRHKDAFVKETIRRALAWRRSDQSLTSNE